MNSCGHSLAVAKVGTKYVKGLMDSLSSWYMYQEAMTYYNCRLACVHTSNNTLNRNWISIYMYKPSSALSSTVQLVQLLHHLCLLFIFILD